MKNSNEFFNLVLDSITENIVVIDAMGEIVFVNKSWSDFGDSNASLVGGDDWIGVNYLEACHKAAAMGDDFGTQAEEGIRSVIEKRTPIFYLEYPCHSPDQKRWFMMRVTSFEADGKSCFVISHQNITERKLAEEEVMCIAREDGLTNIPNRRTFDEFLYEEWRRCTRLKKPISLAIIDLDHFKELNDTYGHQSGDDCLIKVGALLKQLTNRPSDFCARYGGDEFVFVWGDTSLEQAEPLANKLLNMISELNIPNSNSSISEHLTVSIGLAELIPTRDSEESELISKADQMLYRAKESGKNRLER